MKVSAAEALRRAIEAAGGLAKLGRAVGASTQQVWNWKSKGRVPISACPKIEAATGVRCEELRPDINWDYMRQKLAGGGE